MNSTLLLLLRGPMQSWGHDSRYMVRETGPHPTKSGVIGLLAAAEGRRRSDPIEDLAGLRFGVRVDQPGTVQKDFQTAFDWRTGKSMPLINRYYLADAVFVAGIEAPRQLLEGLSEALHKPRFPLYLGRRSCPANHDLVLGVRDAPLDVALRTEPWHASESHRRSRATSVHLPVFRDATGDEAGGSVRDQPVSFAQERREYAWRTVVSASVELSNPCGTSLDDPFLEAVMSA